MEVVPALFAGLVAALVVAGLSAMWFVTVGPLPQKRVVRLGYWPGLPPDTTPGRVMCNTCVHHSAASAGWKWDRCYHPNADLGSVVRNDQRPTCWEIRLSEDQCGPTGAWHTLSQEAGDAE